MVNLQSEVSVKMRNDIKMTTFRFCQVVVGYP